MNSSLRSYQYHDSGKKRRSHYFSAVIVLWCKVLHEEKTVATVWFRYQGIKTFLPSPINNVKYTELLIKMLLKKSTFPLFVNDQRQPCPNSHLHPLPLPSPSADCTFNNTTYPIGALWWDDPGRQCVRYRCSSAGLVEEVLSRLPCARVRRGCVPVRDEPACCHHKYNCMFDYEHNLIPMT